MGRITIHFTAPLQRYLLHFKLKTLMQRSFTLKELLWTHLLHAHRFYPREFAHLTSVFPIRRQKAKLITTLCRILENCGGLLQSFFRQFSISLQIQTCRKLSSLMLDDLSESIRAKIAELVFSLAR